MTEEGENRFMAMRTALATEALFLRRQLPRLEHQPALRSPPPVGY